jgi:LysM repeat protein
LISDHIEGRGEVMRRRNITDNLDADFEINFSDIEGFSVRRKNKENRLSRKPPGKSRFSLLIGVVVLGLVVLVAVLFQRSSSIDSGNKLRSLERRIKRLEERLYRLDWIEANLEEIREENKQFNSFQYTFKEPIAPPKSTTFKKPITPPESTATKEVTTPPQSTATEKPATPPESTTAQPAEEQTEAVYHEVLAGETLYRISLRYGIKVDELRRLNELPDATIYPKQRLLIRPAGNQ